MPQTIPIGKPSNPTESEKYSKSNPLNIKNMHPKPKRIPKSSRRDSKKPISNSHLILKGYEIIHIRYNMIIAPTKISCTSNNSFTGHSFFCRGIIFLLYIHSFPC